MFVTLESLNINDTCIFTDEYHSISVDVDGEETKLLGIWTIVDRLLEYDIEAGKDAWLIKVTQFDKSVWIPGDVKSEIDSTSKPNFMFKELRNGPFKHLGNQMVKIPACFIKSEAMCVISKATGQKTCFPEETITINAVMLTTGSLWTFKEDDLISYDS